MGLKVLFAPLIGLALGMFLCPILRADDLVPREKTATVKADLLRVRSVPSTSADILANIPTGTQVQIIESPAEFAPWVRIRIPDSEGTGWVHGDYLTVRGSGQPAANKSGLQFVRVSIWTGDPRISPPAKPGQTEQYKYYGVHGRFSAGTPFTVIGKDQDQTFSATAKRTIDVEFFPGTDPQPVTEIVFEGEGYRTILPFLAVVGKSIDYKQIRLTEVKDSGKVTELAARVARELSDFKKLPYDYENSGFSATETKAGAFSLQLGEAPAFLVSYKTPYRPYDHPDTVNGYCETAVLLWKGVSLNCSTDGGQGIQFFSIGNRNYCWHNYNSCNNGIRYVEVFELSGGKSVSVYTNGDFAS